MAFTADGHLYRKPDFESTLQVLSQTTSDWQDLGMEKLGELLGADGNSLFSPVGIGPIAMQWFSQSAASGAPRSAACDAWRAIGPSLISANKFKGFVSGGRSLYKEEPRCRKLRTA